VARVMVREALYFLFPCILFPCGGFFWLRAHKFPLLLLSFSVTVVSLCIFLICLRIAFQPMCMMCLSHHHICIVMFWKHEIFRSSISKLSINEFSLLESKLLNVLVFKYIAKNMFRNYTVYLFYRFRKKYVL
jgi:hypothetical protein